MTMVEVFKTNVQEVELAEQLAAELRARFPQFKINFDLQDCDRVLRVEGSRIRPETVVEVVMTSGFECEVLED